MYIRFISDTIRMTRFRKEQFFFFFTSDEYQFQNTKQTCASCSKRLKYISIGIVEIRYFTTSTPHTKVMCIISSVKICIKMWMLLYYIKRHKRKKRTDNQRQWISINAWNRITSLVVSQVFIHFVYIYKEPYE